MSVRVTSYGFRASVRVSVRVGLGASVRVSVRVSFSGIFVVVGLGSR